MDHKGANGDPVIEYASAVVDGKIYIIGGLSGQPTAPN
jgi:hypothetical protein